MKKKILSLCLVVCLLAVAVIGGTLAYFTDNETATNVMQVGNIDINVEEYMVKDGTKIDFDNEEVEDLYPIENAKGMALNNKIVDVYNTSESQTDAYIRVIVAFESVLPEDQEALHYAYLMNNDYAASGTYGVTPTAYDDVTINGTVYDVVVFDTIDGEKIPYGSRVQSLQSVWLDAALTSEQLEDVEDFDILVLAQGIQTEGFDSYDAAMATFGEVNAQNLSDWFAGADAASINDWKPVATN